MMTMSPTSMNKIDDIYDDSWADYPKVESSFNEYPFFQNELAHKNFTPNKYVMKIDDHIILESGPKCKS